MTRLKNLLKINPIIVKEVRSRMRGPRAFITLTVILILMGGIMYAMLQIILANSRYTTVLSPQIGQNLFAALAYLELFMICAVTPSVTAGAISSEKERLTYEMLLATPMSPASILWGKLISALSYVFLLLFAAVPLASVIFIFGGVAPRDMLKVLLVLVVTAVSFGVLGLFMSALFGRTGRATIASFVAVLALMMGPLFLTVLVAAMRQGEPPRWILAPSPISALAAALAPSLGQGSGAEIFYILGGIFNTGITPISQTSIPRPLYHYSLPFYLVTSLVLYLLATRLVYPTRRWYIRRKDLLLGIIVLVVITGVILGGFALSAGRYELAVNPNAPSSPVIEQVVPMPMPVGIPAEKRVLVIPNTPGGTPTPASGTIDTAAAQISETDQAQIYATVARQLYTVDHTFGDYPPNWPLLYLLNTTDDTIGDPNADQSDPVSLPEPILSETAKQLGDLPAKIMWVDSLDAVQTNPQDNSIENGRGAVITFGNIHPQPDGSVHVSARLHFSGLGASGRTYILTWIDGIWQITGTTGVEWTS
jgi:ABC-2 type transport system permease protein